MVFSHYALRQGLSVDLELSDFARPASQVQEPHLCLLSTGITSESFHPPLLCGFSDLNSGSHPWMERKLLNKLVIYLLIFLCLWVFCLNVWLCSMCIPGA